MVLIYVPKRFFCLLTGVRYAKVRFLVMEKKKRRHSAVRLACKLNYSLAVITMQLTSCAC